MRWSLSDIRHSVHAVSRQFLTANQIWTKRLITVNAFLRWRCVSIHMRLSQYNGNRRPKTCPSSLMRAPRARPPHATVCNAIARPFFRWQPPRLDSRCRAARAARHESLCSSASDPRLITFAPGTCYPPSCASVSHACRRGSDVRLPWHTGGTMHRFFGRASA